MEIRGAVDAHRPADRIRNQEHFDKQIKSLMELKTKLMEQSQKIREKKMDDKTKADLLKNLNDQMNQIDQTINQINQEKMKANKEEKDASDKEVESGASPAAESESYIPSKMGLLLQANLHHSSIHRMGSTRQRLENDSAGLQGEIRLGRIQIERDEPVIRENS